MKQLLEIDQSTISGFRVTTSMVEENKKKRVIIFGAGVTGLSAGIRFLDSGFDVCILEKSMYAGGLAKTIVREGYRLDLGPHHLFSQNETILKEIVGLFGKDELVSVSRDVKLLFHDRYLKYPLTARGVLLHMGLKHAFFGSLSYIWMAFRRLLFRNIKDDNFHDWAKNNFGGYLFEIFFKPYTEQFWGIPCKEMSLDCIPLATKMSFFKTLKMIFLKKFEKKSLSVAERETTLKLFYPVQGIGAIVKKLEDSFLSKGGVIKLNCAVSELICKKDDAFILHYKDGDNLITDEAARIISTIPIPSLVKIIRPVPPASVFQSADNLKYLSTIILYIAISDRDFMDCQYLYMVNRPYNRISNINRFHHKLSPEGENVLALEITCHFDDNTWKNSDDELFEKSIVHLESDQIINRSEVKKFFSVRVKNAYPFYRLGYRENLAEILGHLKQTPNLTLIGRTGAFKYMDIDQCMEDTAGLIKRFKYEGTI